MSNRNHNVLRATAIAAVAGLAAISGMQARPARADFANDQPHFASALADLTLARQLITSEDAASSCVSDSAAADQLTLAIGLIRQAGDNNGADDVSGPVVDAGMPRTERLNRETSLLAEAVHYITQDVAQTNPDGLRNEALGHITSATGYLDTSINSETGSNANIVGFRHTNITQDLIDLREARGLLNMPDKFEPTQDDTSAALHIEDALIDAAASNYDDGFRPPYVPSSDVTLSHSDRLWRAKSLVRDANNDFNATDASNDVSLIKVVNESKEAGRAIDRAISNEDGKQVMGDDRQYRPTGGSW